MAYVIPILRVLASALSLAKGITQAKSAGAPTASSGLQDKHRWMQCVVRNGTQFPLLYESTYFDSGRFWDAPGGASPFQQMNFSLCNGDNTFFTGVSGGSTFRLQLDDNNSFVFAIGWTNPQAGPYTAGVIESDKAETGYDNANSSGRVINSKHIYSGTDEDGNPCQIQFHVSAMPGATTVFEIQQIRL